MIAKTLEKINQDNLRKQPLTSFAVGDTVRVHVKIKEGEKERVQTYSGIVIARKGGGSTETFTVRRISHGVGVERVFPVHSPNVAQIDVEGSGHVRRAKLYFLRDRAGKQARLREKARVRPEG
jgi:large subunit ribosomal protein L19